MNLDKPFLLPVDDGPVYILQKSYVSVDFDPFLLGVPFIHPDVSNLRIRVGAPRNRQGADLSASPKQGVLDDDSGRCIGGVGKFVAEADIPGRIDRWMSGLQAIVDLDPLPLVVLDPDRLKVQTLDIGSASGAGQNFDPQRSSPSCSTAFNMDQLVSVSSFPPSWSCSQGSADAVADKGLLDHLCRIAVLTIQDMGGIVKKGHLASQPPKGLSQFTPDRDLLR